ncbi:hypothetical protein ILFOPFJJ_02667 [Ensifer psoraleae]|nr:hypothetical protein [Sinorhizobium psoraleae]
MTAWLRWTLLTPDTAKYKRNLKDGAARFLLRLAAPMTAAYVKGNRRIFADVGRN